MREHMRQTVKHLLRYRTLIGLLSGTIIIALLVGLLFQPQSTVFALPVLTVAPITWNVIGLDSNDVNVGPNNFPVGVRVCNTGPDPATNVTATFEWDDGNDKYTGDTYINLRSGSLDSITFPGTLASGSCTDFYFEATVTRNASAYDHTRSYHIDITSDEGVLTTTTQPRELYVEHLISQSRNSTTDIQLDGVSVAPGGTMVLMVGNTYDITLYGSTATNGYEQIETFINFPNTIFKINSVATTYSAPVNPTNRDMLYEDGCTWENDPDSPNYRSCLGVGKYGGDVVVTYNVTIIGGAGTSETLNSLIYDFSGSSYHYNSDFSLNGRIAQIVNASIDKAFSPKTITPGGTSTLTLTINNPGTSAISNVNFIDTLPGGAGGVEIEGTTVTYTNCGTPSPASMTDGDQALSFSNITVPALGSCTIEVTVTATNESLYTNTTGNLYLDSIDTGDNASDNLQVTSLPAPPATCASPVAMAEWTVPADTGTSPVANILVGGVSTAAATPGLTGPAPSFSVTNVAGVTTNAWEIFDVWSNVTAPPGGTNPPYFQFRIDTSNYGGAFISFQYDLETPGQWAANNNNTVYVYSSTDGTNFNLAGSTAATKGSWQPLVTANAVATGVSETWFRINAVTRGNQARSSILLDNITISGCPRPEPPTLSKAFATDPIAQGSASTLRFTFTNPNAFNLAGVGFSDTLPSGLLINTPNGLTGITCTAGSIVTAPTITASAGTSIINMSGAELSANADCYFEVDVQGVTAGQYTNTSDNISATDTGPNTGGANVGYGEDDLTVLAPPVISKSFGANAILTGTNTTLTFSIYNPNPSTTLTGIQFTDTLPAGLDVVVVAPSSQCNGGTLTTADTNPDTVSLTGGSLAAGATCTFSVTVTGSTIGLKQNSVTVSSTEGGTGNTATANLLVRDPVASLNFLKQVGPSSTGPWSSYLAIETSDPVHYRFVVENTGDQSLTNVDIAETVAIVPAGLDVSTCAWEDGDGDALIAPFTLPVADASDDDHIAYCVLGPVAAQSGSHANTAEADSDQTTQVSSTATYATVGLTLVKSALPLVYSAAGDIITYTYQVTNSGSASLPGPVTVSDDRIVAPNPVTEVTCDAVSAASPGDGDNIFEPGETVTCTADYTITAADVTAGTVINTATATVYGFDSNDDSETVGLAAPAVDLVKTGTLNDDDGTPGLSAGDTISYAFTVTNTGNVTLTNVSVSDPTVTVSGGPLASLGVGASDNTTFTGSYTLTQADIDAGTFTNTASVNTGEGASDSDSDTQTLTGSPGLSVVKEVSIDGGTNWSDANAAPGPYLLNVTNPQFRYTVRNTGNVSLDVTLTDSDFALPPACDPGVLAADDGGAGGPDEFTCTITAAWAAGQHTNTAIAQATYGGLPYIDSDDANYFGAAPALDLLKEVFDGSNWYDANAAPGPTIGSAVSPQFRFTVFNTGNVPLDVTLIDSDFALPPACDPGVLAANDGGAGGPDEFTCTITAAWAAGQHTNTASASGTFTDDDSNQQNVQDPDAANYFGLGPGLTIDKDTSTPQVSINGTVTYTIEIVNTGNVDLTNFQVSDTLPVFGGTSTVSVSAPGFTLNGTYTGVAPNTDILAGTDTLSVGATATITITVNLNGATTGTYDNTAIVTTTETGSVDDDGAVAGDPGTPGVGADPEDDEDVVVGNLFDPPLGSKVLNAELLPELEWRMVWINDSNTAAIDVQITDAIPAGTTFVPGSLTCVPTGGSSSAAVVTAPLNPAFPNCAYDSTNNRIQWQGNIDPDPGAIDETTAANEIVITFRVTVLAGVNQVNNRGSSLTDRNGDTSFADETTSASVSVSNLVIWRRGGGAGASGDPGTLPATGYPPGVVSTLPAQPEESRYQDLGDVWLEIPALGVKLPVVGVPQAKDGGWDVTWLWDQAGWLQGTAFPTWQGNSVLTSHVYLSNGLPGPFISLARLRWGDLVVVHAFGDRYIYEVRSEEVLQANDVSVLGHEEHAWLTLLTCMNYQEREDRYANRIAVRAVLIKVVPE